MVLTPFRGARHGERKFARICIEGAQFALTRPTHIIRDRDIKYTPKFEAQLRHTGIEFRPTPPRSPNMNPFAESWVRAIKHECLNHFMIFGEQHLRYLVTEYLEHYHRDRPHQGLGNRPPDLQVPPPAIDPVDPQQIRCRKRLAGVLKSYERVAA